MLRPYQAEALIASKCKYQANVTRQLISLPTGTGKTVIFANLKTHHDITKRMLVLVHTEELARQALLKLRKYNPGVRIGIEKADIQASLSDEIIIGSVPTLGRANTNRLSMLDPTTFGAIVCDEAHHATANSYRRIFEHFGLHQPSNGILLLGVTATPYRRSGHLLHGVFQETVFQMPIDRAIDEGWLVDLRGYRVRSGTSLDQIGESNGDFNLQQLESEVNTRTRNELIVRSWYELAERRQTIVFCVDIEHAKDLAQAFRDEKVAASAVWGTDGHREDKIDRHKRGELAVLTNCGVLIEGYDDPSVGCIILARPTLSQPLFVQMIGRGTRLENGIQNLQSAKREGRVISKPDCIVIDVVDNTRVHRIMSLPVAFGLDPEIRLEGRRFSSVLTTCSREEKAIGPAASLLDRANSISVANEYIDLFAPMWEGDVLSQAISRWYRQKDAFIRPLPDDGFIRISRVDGHWSVTGRIEGNDLSPFKSSSFAEASGHAEKMFSSFARNLVHRVRTELRESRGMATPTQLQMLNEMGFSTRFLNLNWEEANHHLVMASEKALEAKCIVTAISDKSSLASRSNSPSESRSEDVVDLNTQEMRWTDPMLQRSSLQWYRTDGIGFECPLPHSRALNVRKVKNSWMASWPAPDGDYQERTCDSLNEAARLLENDVLSLNRELQAALHLEAASDSYGVTLLQLELLKNLRGRCETDADLSRDAASKIIRGFYSAELRLPAAIGAGDLTDYEVRVPRNPMTENDGEVW